LQSTPAKTWSLVEPYARRRLGVLLLVVGLSSITAAAEGGVLALAQPAWKALFPGVDETLVDGKTRDVFGWVQPHASSWTGIEDPQMALLVCVAVLASVLGVITAISQMGVTWFSRKASFQMIVDLRVDMTRHLMGLSMRYHGARRFGDLLSRVSSDVTTVLESVNVAMKGLVFEPIRALVAIGLAFYFAPIPALLLFFVMPVAIVPVSRLFSRVRKGSKKSLTSLGDSVHSLTQMFQGIRTVKAFGGEERELERYRQLSQAYLKDSMKMVRAIARIHAWTALYSAVGVAIIVLVFGTLKLRYGMFQNGGHMLIFMGAVAELSSRVKDITKTWTKVQESVGASERLLEVLAEPVEVVEAPNPVPLPAIRQGIRLEGLTFRYPEGEAPALRQVDLEIRPGETLALVGPSGAGKSTLIDLLARFVDPTEGRITVDGTDLREIKVADWNALYAMVGQVPFLFHSTIGENIAYGKPDATRQEIEAAARAAHIHEFIVSLPQGYETDVADMGSRLSGGQRQRITIARALLKGAPLLLLDEATSALDSESEAEVQRALDELVKEKTVVVVAHRLSTIQGADRVAVLDRGRVVELGTHKDLLARHGIYERLWSLQKLDIRPEVASTAEGS